MKLYKMQQKPKYNRSKKDRSSRKIFTGYRGLYTYEYILMKEPFNLNLGKRLASYKRGGREHLLYKL